MPTKTKYPQTTSQTTGGKYATFNDLGNIKASSNYAQTKLIKGKKKSPNRPSTVTVKKFKTGLPTGALASKVQVKYKHMKTAQGKMCNIPAPTIELYNGSTKLASKKGQAPTKDPKEQTVTFSKKINYDVINKDDFSVKINYPTNTNNESGYVRLYYVKIIVTYKTANYGLWGQASDVYKGQECMLEVGVTNSNLVKSSPKVTVLAPEGFSVSSSMSNVKSVQVVNARTVIWTPQTSVDMDIITIVWDCNVSFPSSTESLSRTFSASESLSGHTKNYTCTVYKEPYYEEDEEQEPADTKKIIDDDSAKLLNREVLFVTPDEEFSIDFSFEDYSKSDVLLYCCLITSNGYGGDFEDAAITSCSEDMKIYQMVAHQWAWRTVTYTSPSIIPLQYGLTDERMQNNFKITAKGEYALLITDKDDTSNVLKRIDICVKPATLTVPNATLLTLSQEELNRFGDGYSYTVQSFLKILNEHYVRDWGTNYRIGVFNNNIGDIEILNINGEIIEVDPTPDNPTVNQIIENAEYWSTCLNDVGAYENVECEFRYDKKYPLYIIITGDNPESGVSASIKFTEPCIVETKYYNQQTNNGVYPIPITDLIQNDGSTSEVNITAQNTSDTIVLYDWPLEDNFGTNDEIVVRGISVNGTIEQNTDDLILNVTLVDDKKESHERSIVLDELDLSEKENQISIGQVGDLFGFKPSEIENLEDWEVHITLSNALNTYDAICNFGNLNMTVYVEEIEHQNIKCVVEGEDVGYYGAFLQDVKIPEGLKTDTDYLQVDGTDVNDPYRQNIRAKTIELEFSLGDGCDLEGATLSLRELTRLLTNRRDKYNRPIPKRIEFSHYPDVYWEYILEEPVDNDVEINSYKCKAKLTIPAGTSYDRETTSTNTTGYVSGLAAVRPVIQISPTETVFSITETISNQEFNMGYTGDTTGKIIEIDCENHIVWLKESEEDTEPTNISKYVDINADFFTLYEEYQFTGTGCVIRSVDYAERW